MRAICFATLLCAAAPALAAPACLTGDQARVGIVGVVQHQMLNNSWERFYLLRLPKKSCVLDSDGQTHEGQSEIGLFPKDPRRMAAAVGRKVRIDGDGPIVGDTQWHIRDLTFMDAVAVPIR